MKGEVEESGMTVCGGWAKEVDYAVTKDITLHISWSFCNGLSSRTLMIRVKLIFHNRAL